MCNTISFLYFCVNDFPYKEINYTSLEYKQSIETQ